MAHGSPRPLAATVLVALSVLVAGCASSSKIRVNQDFTRGTDFKPYRTFAFLPPPKMQEWYGADAPLPPDVWSYCENAVGRELVARGLRPVDAAQADLRVAFHINVRGAVEKASYGRTYQYDATGNATAVPITKEIKEGMLVVDLIDARKGDMLWRGAGEGKPERTSIDYAAAAILAQYPPAD